MANRNAKRVAKRLKRESDEFKTVVDQCIHILGLYGYPIQFPWEVPHALEQLIKNAGMAPGTSTSAPLGSPNGSREAAFDRLAGLTGAMAGQPAQPTPGAPPAASAAAQQFYTAQGGPAHGAPAMPRHPTEAAPAAPDPFEGDPWAAAANAAGSSFDDIFDDQPQAAPPGAPVQGQNPALPGGMTPEEAMRIFEAKNAAMMSRLESNGVSYKGKPGPAQGKKLVPHPSVKVPSGPGALLPPAQQQPPAQAGGGEGYESPYVMPGGGDGPRNPKNGMTREQMVEAIARATGKPPADPEANPHAKPPGF